MANGTYVLIQKTISKVTDEAKNEELLVSNLRVCGFTIKKRGL